MPREALREQLHQALTDRLGGDAELLEIARRAMEAAVEALAEPGATQETVARRALAAAAPGLSEAQRAVAEAGVRLRPGSGR